MNINIPFPNSEQISLSVSFTDDFITRIEFIAADLSQDEWMQCRALDDNSSSAALLETQIKQQFKHYFLNSEHHFSLPYQLHKGTEFQQKVWQALIQIPAGEVKTYGQLARELDSSPRAVGNACRSNHYPVIIPCHRVVSASGIGGYAGDTLTSQTGSIAFLSIKHWLLAHEKANIK